MLHIGLFLWRWAIFGGGVVGHGNYWRSHYYQPNFFKGSFW